MRGYFIKNIGSNRTKPRIWLDRQEITTAGMKPGDRYEVQMKGGTIILRADPNGSRVVSSKTNKSGTYPVIDLESKALLSLFADMSAIRLVQRDGEIHLLPLASEIRKKERLNRVRHKLTEGIPLDVGSMAHGIGLLSSSVHEGLEQAGIASQARMVNEIRPELLAHAEGVSNHWNDKTMIVAAPLQEFAFDDAAQRHVPKVDVFEAGLPCSGASVAGRAKRKTAKPEDHPEVGHLIVGALVIALKANPAILLLESVVPYASSASASILRSQLRDMGYVTHETVLNGNDFNSLENRSRWCMVAVTEGIHFDWSMLQLPEKKTMTLSDVLEDISPDDPMWSEMAGLKAKQVRDIEKGNSFLMQTFSASAEHIGTLTKGYAKVRSTDPKIEHPTDPNLLRQITPIEHARIKQHPENLIEGLTKTIAHEALGQGVLRAPFAAVGKLIGEVLLDFAEGKQPLSMKTLVESMAAEFKDTAAMVVSEVSKPLAGVVYEGPVTINQQGMVVQDVGNGVGVVHKANTLANVKLGEVLRVQYPSTAQAPRVEHLSRPSPAQSERLVKAMDNDRRQQSLFDAPSPAEGLVAIADSALAAMNSGQDDSVALPVPRTIESIYKNPPPTITKGPSM